MKNYLFLTISASVFMTARVGINKTNPNSTLAINDSFEASYREIITNTYNINSILYPILLHVFTIS